MALLLQEKPGLSVSLPSEGRGRCLDAATGVFRSSTPDENPSRVVDGNLAKLLGQVRMDLGISGPLLVRLQLGKGAREVFAGYLERSPMTGGLLLSSFENPGVDISMPGSRMVLPIRMAPLKSDSDVQRVTALLTLTPFQGERNTAWVTVFDGDLQVKGGLGLSRLGELVGRTVEVRSYVTEDGPTDERTYFGRVGVTEDGLVALYDPLERTKRPIVFRDLHTVSQISLATLPAYWDPQLNSDHLAGGSEAEKISALFQFGTAATVSCCPPGGSRQEPLVGEFREIVTGRYGETLLTVFNGKDLLSVPLAHIQSIATEGATRDSFVELLRMAKEARKIPDSVQKRLPPLPYEPTIALGSFR